MSDDFESLIERRRKGESRIHVDLTDRFRERLLHILTSITGESKVNAYTTLFERLGYSEVQEEIFPTADDPMEVVQFVQRKDSNAETNTILEASTEFTLSYVECVLRQEWSDSEGKSPPSVDRRANLQTVITKIIKALESEGILWELSGLATGDIKFEEMGSKTMQDADDELRDLALGETWEEPLRGYNEAYELYLDRKYGKEIPEKLYNSIEAVMQTICVDLEGWEDNEDRNLKHYLDILREQEVFAPNPIMKAEVGDLVDSMERAFSKAGNDRKNRHELIDRRYCTLMLHQVSAYLVFIIKRYEDKYGSAS